MTTPEITAYVMALTPEQVCNESATRIMGWHLRDWAVRTDGKPWVPVMVWSPEEINEGCKEFSWRPDIDRNQSRMVTDKVMEYLTIGNMRNADFDQMAWWKVTPDQETRAALIAHMTHEEESKGK